MRIIAIIALALIALLPVVVGPPARADGLAPKTEARAVQARTSAARVTFERGVRVFRSVSVASYGVSSTGYGNGASVAGHPIDGGYSTAANDGFYGTNGSYYGGYYGGFGYLPGLPASQRKHQRTAAVANPVLVRGITARTGSRLATSTAPGPVAIHRPVVPAHAFTPSHGTWGAGPGIAPGGAHSGRAAGPAGLRPTGAGPMLGRMSVGGPGGARGGTAVGHGRR